MFRDKFVDFDSTLLKLNRKINSLYLTKTVHSSDSDYSSLDDQSPDGTDNFSPSNRIPSIESHSPYNDSPTLVERVVIDSTDSPNSAYFYPETYQPSYNGNIPTLNISNYMTSENLPTYGKFSPTEMPCFDSAYVDHNANKNYNNSNNSNSKNDANKCSKGSEYYVDAIGRENQIDIDKCFEHIEQHKELDAQSSGLENYMRMKKSHMYLPFSFSTSSQCKSPSLQNHTVSSIDSNSYTKFPNSIDSNSYTKFQNKIECLSEKIVHNKADVPFRSVNSNVCTQSDSTKPSPIEVDSQFSDILNYLHTQCEPSSVQNDCEIKPSEGCLCRTSQTMCRCRENNEVYENMIDTHDCRKSSYFATQPSVRNESKMNNPCKMHDPCRDIINDQFSANRTLNHRADTAQYNTLDKLVTGSDNMNRNKSLYEITRHGNKLLDKDKSENRPNRNLYTDVVEIKPNSKLPGNHDGNLDETNSNQNNFKKPLTPNLNTKFHVKSNVNIRQGAKNDEIKASLDKLDTILSSDDYNFDNYDSGSVYSFLDVQSCYSSLNTSMASTLDRTVTDDSLLDITSATYESLDTMSLNRNMSLPLAEIRRLNQSNMSYSTLQPRRSRYPQGSASEWRMEMLRRVSDMVTPFPAAKVPIHVEMENGQLSTIEVSETTTAGQACRLLISQSRLSDHMDWTLAECVTDKLERSLEDHERVLLVARSWTGLYSCKLALRRDPLKYAAFLNPQLLFPAHMTDRRSETGNISDLAGKAKVIHLQNMLLSSDRIPDLRTHVYLKSADKRSWHKCSVVVRGSGLYYSVKSNSKDPRNLKCFCRLDEVEFYRLSTSTVGNSKHKYIIAILPHTGTKDVKLDLKKLQCLKTKDEATLASLLTVIRIAKHGGRVRESYHAARARLGLTNEN